MQYQLSNLVIDRLKVISLEFEFEFDICELQLNLIALLLYDVGYLWYIIHPFKAFKGSLINEFN